MSVSLLSCCFPTLGQLFLSRRDNAFFGEAELLRQRLSPQKAAIGGLSSSDDGFHCFRLFIDKLMRRGT